MDDEDWVVVYRGFAVPALDLVQAMLDAEGLDPRRLGQANPALLGAGNFAVEQLIEVPSKHEQAALALLAASLQGPAAGAQEELDTLALSTSPESSRPALPERGGFGAITISLIFAVGTLLFIWLRQ